ncbi:MAG: alpha/beta fold hydrolase [Chromatiales bacterium]|jgi:2-hydroxy-6-oxonona-2,4-dienedioate hydrolase|nr:alpha/beta fold hydrolase [Chromatiales bacterium]
MHLNPIPIDVESYPRPARALAAQARKYTTPCADGTMSWHVWGEGDPLVLLHGGSGSWTHWLRNIEALASQHMVWAADLPGLGESDMPAQPFDHGNLAGSVAHWGGIVADGIDQLVETPYHLAGFSFGSIIGAHLAGARPQRMRSMTVIGGASMGMPWAGLRGRLRPMDDSMTEAECVAVQAHNLGVMMLNNWDEIDETAGALQLHNARRARARSHPLASGDVLRNAIPNIKVPIGFIWGDADIYALPDLAGRIDYLLKHQPQARVELIEGAGHWVMHERAQACTEALLRCVAAS